MSNSSLLPVLVSSPVAPSHSAGPRFVSRSLIGREHQLQLPQMMTNSAAVPCAAGPFPACPLARLIRFPVWQTRNSVKIIKCIEINYLITMVFTGCWLLRDVGFYGMLVFTGCWFSSLPRSSISSSSSLANSEFCRRKKKRK